MNKQLKLYKKIHRKYDANHWWLKDYKNHNIIINQNYINKVFILKVKLYNTQLLFKNLIIYLFHKEEL